MEQIKELTKRLIANSFKELMLQMPFEKITIKMITDHASVIRPTFYNHFHDKYELVEWIIQDEILDEVSQAIMSDKSEAGITILFTRFYEDRAYYRKAFEIEGQNGFAETFAMLLSRILTAAIDTKKIACGNSLITSELVGQYYSSGLITVLKLVIKESNDAPIDEIIGAYQYMVSHTLYELVK